MSEPSTPTEAQPAAQTEAQNFAWFELFNEIGIINQLATTRFERVLPENLTLSQFSVLNNFVRLGGSRTPLQLANAFQVTKGAMTNTLKKLAARDCIKITADPSDGRGKIVEITAKGVALREAAIVAAMDELADMRGHLSSEALQTLLPQLRGLRAALDAARAVG